MGTDNGGCQTTAIKTKTRRERKWWRPVFSKKKNKRLVEILTDCNNRLTSLIEEQTRLISTLTFENGRNDRTVREYEQKIHKLTEDIGKLEDRVKSSGELQEGQRDTIQHQYYDIQTLTREKQDLTSLKSALEQDNHRLSEEMVKKKQEILNKKEIVERLEADKRTITDTNISLKDDLAVTNQTLYEETVKYKLLQKDHQITLRLLKEEQNKTEVLEKKVADVQNNLLVVTASKSKMENELGTVNECLKYDIFKLLKKIDRKRMKEKKLQRDKDLILQYYRNQDNLYQLTDYGLRLKNNMCHIVDVSCAEFFKNKMFSLESRLYRRCQLIDELCDIIKESDPDFSIESSPVLKHYLDNETSDHTLVSGCITDQDDEGHLTETLRSPDVYMNSEDSFTDTDNSSDCSIDNTNLNCLGLCSEANSAQKQPLTLYENGEVIEI